MKNHYLNYKNNLSFIKIYMENLNIISQSLEYMDKNINNHKSFFTKINYINIIRSQSNNYKDMNVIEFYDRDMNLIKSSRYEILGTYNMTNMIWTWGWSIARLNKNAVNTAKKIFNYGFDLDDNNLYLKNELITSRFKISNPIQLDMHVAIGAYLSKKEIIYSYRIYNDSINKNNILVHNNIELLNTKKKYDNEPYNEYYMIILD